LEEAQEKKVKCEVIHNASVLDAVAETGLQLYKFGKIASMPFFEADSYIKIIKDNQKINAHSLILIDMGMDFGQALKKLQADANRQNLKLDKLIVCSALGTECAKIYYESLKELKTKKIKKPFCFIIPGKLHFIEEEVLEQYKI